MLPEQINSIRYSFRNFPSVLDKFNEIVFNTKQPIKSSIPSIFPSITSDSPLDRSKYICYIAGLAGIDNVNPVISGDIDFGYDQLVPDFASLTGIGDPRLSFGEMLSSVYAEFQPRTELYLELQREGGCQVIENYICDADGNPIRELTNSCAQFLNIDPTLIETEETINLPSITISPIQSTEVIEYVASLYSDAIQNHANKFITYIRKTYIEQNWNVSLYVIEDLPFFYVKAIQPTQSSTVTYLKYYYDQKDYVSLVLNIPIQVRASNTIDDSDPTGVKLYQVMAQPINNY